MSDRTSDDAPLNEKVTAMWNELFASFDPKMGLRRLIYRGFDSFEDYERYGDAYISLNVTNRR